MFTIIKTVVGLWLTLLSEGVWLTLIYMTNGDNQIYVKQLMKCYYKWYYNQYVLKIVIFRNMNDILDD